MTEPLPTAERIRALAKQGLTKAEAGRVFGLERSKMTKVVRKLAPEVEWRTRMDRVAELVERMKVYAEEGKTREEVAKLEGLSYGWVCSVAHRHAIPLKGSGPKPARGRHLRGEAMKAYRVIRSKKYPAAEAIAIVERDYAA